MGGLWFMVAPLAQIAKRASSLTAGRTVSGMFLHEAHQYVWRSERICRGRHRPDVNHSFGPSNDERRSLVDRESRRTTRMIGCQGLAF